MINDAISALVDYDRAKASLLQRHLKIEYARADVEAKG